MFTTIKKKKLLGGGGEGEKGGWDSEPEGIKLKGKGNLHVSQSPENKGLTRSVCMGDE